MKKLIFILMTLTCLGTMAQENEIAVFHFYNDVCLLNDTVEGGELLFTTLICDRGHYVSITIIQEHILKKDFEELKKFVNDTPFVKIKIMKDFDQIFLIEYNYRILSAWDFMDEICTYVYNNF